jgi:hypothetical protein
MEGLQLERKDIPLNTKQKYIPLNSHHKCRPAMLPDQEVR